MSRGSRPAYSAAVAGRVLGSSAIGSPGMSAARWGERGLLSMSTGAGMDWQPKPSAGRGLPPRRAPGSPPGGPPARRERHPAPPYLDTPVRMDQGAPLPPPHKEGAAIPLEETFREFPAN